MPAVLRSPLRGTRRDVETPFSQESLFAERATQQKLIAATQDERPFAYEQSPPAVITGERLLAPGRDSPGAVSYTHLRAHETRHDLVCRLLLEKKKNHIARAP